MIKFEFSDTARKINVYGFDYLTREFTGEYEAHIAPHTGLPGNSTTVEPPEFVEGKIAVYDIDSATWNLETDLRGLTAWHKITKKPFYIDEIGDIDDKFTTIKPDSDFDVWDGEKWVKDGKAEARFRLQEEEQHKALLMAFAESRIALLSRAVNKGIATDAEKEKLEQWEIYSVLLNRVDVSVGDVVYPETPE